MVRAHSAGLLAALLFLTAIPPLPARASEPSYQLSARVYWEDAGGKKPALSDLCRVGTDWREEGADLVFSGSFAPGETTELFQGVTIPAWWGSEMAGKDLSLVVEAAVSTSSGTAPCRLVIEEFETDPSGKEVPYVNGKTVLPGERISKIVRIRMEQQERSTVREAADAAAAAKTSGETETTHALVIPLDGSAPASLPTDGSLPAIEKSRSGAIRASRAAKTSDSWDPRAFAAGILAGGIVLALWFQSKRRR